MKLFNLICMWDFGINQEIKTLGILELNERILHVGWMWILVAMGWTHWVEQHALKSHVHPDAQNMTLFIVHFSSVTQSCLTLWDPMDCSTPGLPDHHQLLEFTQAHVHWVRDAIQPSHPLSSLSPPDFSLAHHQGLHKWVISLHQVAKGLEFQLQHQSFQWTTHNWSPLGWTGWISLQSKGLSRVFSNTTVQKHQFFGTQLSL